MKGLFKKLPFAFIIVAILLSMLTVSAVAARSGDYIYVVSNGKAIITKYTGSGSAVSLPSRLGGYPVTGIGSRSFEFCDSLTSVMIPRGVTGIGDSAFYNCINLTSVSIPNSVICIWDRAFERCSRLTSVTIPASVTTIGRWAFSGCSGLTGITIPDSVTSIGDRAFAYCNKIKAFYVSASSSNYASLDGVLFNKTKNVLIQYPIGNDRTAYTIPASVIYIWDMAFASCSRLTSVTIPASVNTIGGLAFYGCSGLAGITIPDSVTHIGEEALAFCTKLEAICVSASSSEYTSLDGVLFDKAKEYLIQYPIGNDRTTYTIPSSVTAIGYSAFDGCGSLTSVTIPASVFYIGEPVFGYCDKLAAIQVNALNERYASQSGVLFDKAKTKLIQYPIGNVRTIYTIPGSVTAIGHYAFQDCDNLKSVAIPSSITAIGYFAFEGCGSLTSVTIPASVTVIEELAFGNCDKLASIYVNASNERYASQDGALFDKAKTELIQYPIGNPRTSYTIPESVTAIEHNAFKSSSNLTSVTIPASVSGIASYAFTESYNLAKAFFQGNAPYMEIGVFDKCRANFTVYFPKGMPDYTNPWHGYPTVPYVVPSVPTSLQVSSASYNSVKLTWENYEYDDGYEVYRATSGSGAYAKVSTISDGGTLTCTDGNLTTGTTYYYKVRTYNLVSGIKMYSGYSAVKSAKPIPAAPALSSAVSGGTTASD